MKAHLKSGKVIYVRQKTAEAIIEAKLNPRRDGDLIIERYKIGKNVKFFIDVSEVSAIT